MKLYYKLYKYIKFLLAEKFNVDYVLFLKFEKLLTLFLLLAEKFKADYVLFESEKVFPTHSHRKIIRIIAKTDKI